MSAWAIDLDGVMWRGSEGIPRAAQAVAELRAAGASVLFVTNSSVRTPAEVASKLAEHGVPDASDLVVTSAVAAASLVDPSDAVYVIGGSGIRAAVEERGATLLDRSGALSGEANVVVVGLSHDFHYDDLAAAMAAIRGGARFVATNDDTSFPTSGGRLLPGNGALVAAVSTSASASPTVAGKPHSPIVDLVRERLGGNGVMVGDRPETDGLFARALGYRFGLVLTGVTAADAIPDDPKPDLVATDLSALVALERGQG